MRWTLTSATFLPAPLAQPGHCEPPPVGQEEEREKEECFTMIPDWIINSKNQFSSSPFCRPPAHSRRWIHSVKQREVLFKWLESVDWQLSNKRKIFYKLYSASVFLFVDTIWTASISQSNNWWIWIELWVNQRFTSQLRDPTTKKPSNTLLVWFSVNLEYQLNSNHIQMIAN